MSGQCPSLANSNEYGGFLFDSLELPKEQIKNSDCLLYLLSWIHSEFSLIPPTSEGRFLKMNFIIPQSFLRYVYKMSAYPKITLFLFPVTCQTVSVYFTPRIVHRFWRSISMVLKPTIFLLRRYNAVFLVRIILERYSRILWSNVSFVYFSRETLSQWQQEVGH